MCIIPQWVANAVDSQLFAAAGETFSVLKQQFWATMDEEISLLDCDIYRYVKLLYVYAYVEPLVS